MRPARRRRLASLVWRAAAPALATLLLVAPPPSALRVSAAVAAEAETSQEWLAQIERYLDGVRTLQSAFVQSSSNGEAARGILYLSRPGRLRIDYAPPTPILVVADGQFLVYYDRSLEQLSHVPLGSTPASLLLQERIALSDRSMTLASLETTDELVSVTLVRTDSPGEGSLRLSFQKEPLRLSHWTIIDPQGVITEVTLVDPQFNGKIDAKLFRFVDPRSTQQSP